MHYTTKADQTQNLNRPALLLQKESDPDFYHEYEVMQKLEKLIFSPEPLPQLADLTFLPEVFLVEGMGDRSYGRQG